MKGNLVASDHEKFQVQKKFYHHFTSNRLKKFDTCKDEAICEPTPIDPPNKHLPVPIAPTIIKKSQLGRKNCNYCYSKHKKEFKTPWKCNICNLPLCVLPERNCFFDYHT